MQTTGLLLREALKSMGRADLIGNGKKHLIPTYQPAGTGQQMEGVRRKSKAPARPFKTQQTHGMKKRRRR